MTFRFLHLADLHLETRFGGRAEVRARLREATLEAFRRAVDLAVESELHALLVAGDAFDDELLSRRTELAFVADVRRAAEAGVHVLYATGNHDPGSARHRAARLGLEPDGVGRPWHERVHVFRSATPEVVRVTELGGRTVGVVVGAGHVTAHEERNLAARFRPLERSFPRVGLLHTQVEGAARGDEHARYAPSTREDLAAVDYDYWALGHVHQRQRPFPDVPAWYPGNLQGRHAKETGPKGGLLVELEAGEPAHPIFVPLAPIRWERLVLDATPALATFDALATAIGRALTQAAGTGPGELAARVVLQGRTPLARDLADEDARRDLEDTLRERTGALEVEIDARRVARPRDLTALRATPCVVSAALELLGEARGDPAVLRALAPGRMAGLDEDADTATRDVYLRELLAGLEEELLERALDADFGSDSREARR